MRRPDARVAGGGQALMLALLLGVGHPPIRALGQQPVGSVMRFDGKATITRAGTPSPAVLGDPVMSGDRITLGAESHIEILLGDVAVLTVHPFSALTVTEEPNGVLITLNGGTVILDVNAAKLKPGEVHEIHTPAAVVRMWGAKVAVAVGQEVTNIDCVSGEVLVAVADRPFVQCTADRGFAIRF